MSLSQLKEEKKRVPHVTNSWYRLGLDWSTDGAKAQSTVFPFFFTETNEEVLDFVKKKKGFALKGMSPNWGQVTYLYRLGLAVQQSEKGKNLTAQKKSGILRKVKIQPIMQKIKRANIKDLHTIKSSILVSDLGRCISLR